MPPFKAEAFSALLAQTEQLHRGLPTYLQEIQNFNIEWTFGMVQELARAIRSHMQPLRSINALIAIERCMEKGSYPFLLFAEIYIIPSLAKVVLYLLDNRDFQAIASYFEKNGCISNTPHIQNISYNYVALAYKIFELGANIKPYHVYQGREYGQISPYKRWFDKLLKEKINLSLSNNGQKKSEYQKLCELYTFSLTKWDQFEDSLIQFFMEMLEAYLLADNQQKNSPLLEILQYGESSITGQAIARLIDIITHNLSFDLRIKALKLFDKMILWGDVQALLVVNFTENIEIIIKNCFRVKGEESIEEGRYIYPEISNQQTKKLEFYKLFLVCLQNWAISFPNHEFLVLEPSNTSDPSPIYQLYKLLREKKSTIFPSNPNLIKYETQSRRAFLEKVLRNKLILKDINNNNTPQSSESSHLHQNNNYQIQQVQQYYESHKEMMVNLIAKKQNIYHCMQKFSEFRMRFEQKIQNLSIEESPTPDFDRTIDNGLELIEIIDLVQDPYHQLLHGGINQKEFLDKVMSICINFFSPNEDHDLIHFYSERVTNKRESLVNLLKTQRSNPLEKDLKNITNSIIVRQFRQNYKQKLSKISSGKCSQQSQMNLEIFTRSKFTRQSRQQMEKMQSLKIEQKESLNNTLSPTKADLLKVKNSITPNSANSLNNSRQKKKLSIVSKQRSSNDKNVQNQNIVSSQLVKKTVKNQSSSDTRSSRQQNKEHELQKCLKITNNEVSFHENSQYFSYLPNQLYKFSYLYPNILIFKSPYLTIERFIKHSPDDNKVKIEFVLSPHKQLCDFSIHIQDQQCIKMDKANIKLPSLLQQNRQYKLEVTGQMRKIPLRLPSIAFFLRYTLVFQYILPFTINFFLVPNKQPSQVMQHHNKVQLQPKSLHYTSSKLHLSKLLFPQLTLSNLPSYLNASFLHQSTLQRQKYLWQVTYGKLSFLFTFDLNLHFKTVIIKGYDLNRYDNYNESMLRYVINFLAHLIGERQA